MNNRLVRRAQRYESIAQSSHSQREQVWFLKSAAAVLDLAGIASAPDPERRRNFAAHHGQRSSVVSLRLER